MQNIKVEVSKDKKTATFVVDLTQRLGESSSGKTTIIASTQGNRPLDGVPDVSFGLTVYTKTEEQKAKKKGSAKQDA